MMWGRRRRLPHCAAAPSSLYTLPSPSLLPTSSLSSAYLLPLFCLPPPSTGSQSSCWHFGYLLCLFAEHFIAIDFRCQLQAQSDGQADGQTDGQTYGQLDGTETRQVLRLRLKFVGKLKTFSLTGAHNGKNNSSENGAGATAKPPRPSPAPAAAASCCRATTIRATTLGSQFHAFWL